MFYCYYDAVIMVNKDLCTLCVRHLRFFKFIFMFFVFVFFHCYLIGELQLKRERKCGDLIVIPGIPCCFCSVNDVTEAGASACQSLHAADQSDASPRTRCSYISAVI